MEQALAWLVWWCQGMLYAITEPATLTALIVMLGAWPWAFRRFLDSIEREESE